MSRFPMSIDLKGKSVYLVGRGEQIRQKAQVLKPFGPELIYADGFAEPDAETRPAMVVVGDTPPETAKHIADLCRTHHIPVNVVDVPDLCTFYFPALLTRGCLTVSVATEGTAPAAAACLRDRIGRDLPDRTEEILRWLGENRRSLRERGILKAAAAAAFSLDRPLEPEELEKLKTTKTDL